MSVRFVRRLPEARETVSAALVSVAIAASAGLATFYFARILLAREPLRAASPGGSEEAARKGE